MLRTHDAAAASHDAAAGEHAEEHAEEEHHDEEHSEKKVRTWKGWALIIVLFVAVAIGSIGVLGGIAVALNRYLPDTWLAWLTDQLLLVIVALALSALAYLIFLTVRAFRNPEKANLRAISATLFVTVMLWGLTASLAPYLGSTSWLTFGQSTAFGENSRVQANAGVTPARANDWPPITICGDPANPTLIRRGGIMTGERLELRHPLGCIYVRRAVWAGGTTHGPICDNGVTTNTAPDNVEYVWAADGQQFDAMIFFQPR